MSQWPSTKARRVLAALVRIGWVIKRHAAGSHRILSRPGWPDVVLAFHDDEEIGPRTNPPLHLTLSSLRSEVHPLTLGKLL